MSGRLVGEVLDHAEYTGLTHPETRLLCVLAEMAKDDTRSCWPGPDLLVQRMRMESWSGVRKVLASLARKGIEVRVPQRADKHGKPQFAAHGHGMTYRVPALPLYRREPETGVLRCTKAARDGSPSLAGRQPETGVLHSQEGSPRREPFTTTKGARDGTRREPEMGAPNRKEPEEEPSVVADSSHLKVGSGQHELTTEDLAAITEALGGDRAFAVKVAGQVLDRTSERKPSPRGYVLAAIRRRPEDYRPPRLSVTEGKPPHTFDDDGSGLSCRCGLPTASPIHDLPDDSEPDLALDGVELAEPEPNLWLEDC